MLKVPTDLAGRAVLVLDPMLATGGSLLHACRLLDGRGAGPIVAVCVLAAPEGIERIESSGLGVHVGDGRRSTPTSTSTPSSSPASATPATAFFGTVFFASSKSPLEILQSNRALQEGRDSTAGSIGPRFGDRASSSVAALALGGVEVPTGGHLRPRGRTSAWARVPDGPDDDPGAVEVQADDVGRRSPSNPAQVVDGDHRPAGERLVGGDADQPVDHRRHPSQGVEALVPGPSAARSGARHGAGIDVVERGPDRPAGPAATSSAKAIAAEMPSLSRTTPPTHEPERLLVAEHRAQRRAGQGGRGPATGTR